MNYYTYIISRDFGFAPNPFGQHCTLATCKPIIRKKAQIGDWVFGISRKHLGNKLICAMQIDKKITFNEYWKSPEFQYKKPVLNGSLKQMYGDNIYFFDEKTKKWHQENSHHSLDNGEINEHNLKRDTSGEFVIISEHFFYFGKNMIDIPDEIKENFIIGRAFKKVDEKAAIKLIEFLTNKYSYGLLGEPNSFEDFQRYDGVS